MLVVHLSLAIGLAASSAGAIAQFAPLPPSAPQPSSPARPQSPPQPDGYAGSQPSGQQPGNGRAARLTYLAGEVHIDSVAGTGDEAAALNMPIVEGMVVATGDNGQAEIEFEDGSLVRLTPNSAVSLLNLSIGTGGIFETRLALLPGLSYLELRASTRYHFSIDAGGDMISPVENSAVRVDFDEPPAKIAVLDGSIRVVSQAGVSAGAVSGQTLREETIPAQAPGAAQSQGQQGGASGGYGVGAEQGYGQPQQVNQAANATANQAPTQAQPTTTGRFVIKDSLEPNSWDQWNEDRDQAAADDASNQTEARNGYAGDQGYGWSDLDSSGSWYNVPGQGQVWQPDEAAQSGDDAGANSGADSFDPYGYGDWVFTAGYGYVWASGYPWGWTPFRCGNWGYYGGFGWGWSPGAACGLPAYGGRGYHINLNQTLVPTGYRPPRKPGSGPDHHHPPVVVNGGLAPSSPPHFSPVTRRIAGHTAQPLQPIGGGYTPQGGSAVGSALLRDFPVSRATHTAVAGVLPSHDAPPLTASGYRASVWRPVGAPTSNMVPALGKRYSYTPRPPSSQIGSQSGSNSPGTSRSTSGLQTGAAEFGTPSPRSPYTPGGGLVQQPQTPGGAPVYRTYPNNTSYPGYRPPPPSGATSPGGYTNAPAYRQPPAPPVQRATPPPPSPSRPAPTPASSGPGKG